MGFADDDDAFPDCVAVGSEQDGYCCTGTLIAPNVVLTAGHCLPCCNEDRGGLVHIGKRAYGPGKTIKVKKAIRHQDYGRNETHNDLTILVLQEAVQGVKPRPMAPTDLVEHATFVRAVGFGNTNFGGTVGYGTRRMANLPIACVRCLPGDLQGRYGCDPDLELVAGGIGLDVDTCTGDSGGPILVERQPGDWCLAGVTSRMTREAQRTCGDGGIYVRVDKYADWIKRLVEENGMRGTASAGSTAVPASPRSRAPTLSTTSPTPAYRSAPATDPRLAPHVVYVHGICRHSSGYSKDWWAAMKPFIANAIPDANRHEVLWSDLVNRERTARSARSKEQNEAKSRIVDALKDRAFRQWIDVAGETRALLDTEKRQEERRIVDSIPMLDCVDDFTWYLLNDTVRQEVKERFIEVVQPLLQGGARVEVISHSWGTVVAYEALCTMDSRAEQVPGRVAHLFTVGSALSIPEVKRRLESNCANGHRPRLVQFWTNLNARFDIVGGPMQGVPFAVDEEHLGLRPIGCSPFLPNPTCSHSSYFHKDNLPVNRDIFARLINQ
jgi:hypothetical protein